MFDLEEGILRNIVKSKEAVTLLQANNNYVIGSHLSRLSVTVWSLPDLKLVFGISLSAGRELTSVNFYK